MRARVVVLFSFLALAASTVSAQRTISRDCWSRSNSRGGTYISCSPRVDDYAREQRRMTAATQREARALASRVRSESRAYAAVARAESRAFASAARAEARAFERQVRLFDRPIMRIRERIDIPRYRPQRVRIQRW